MTTVKDLQEKSAKLRQFFDQHLPYARPTPVLADFVRVQHELMWGGVWQAEGLDLKLRSYATITAQCVNGYDFGVEHQVRTGLTVGITPQQIKGIFIQLMFYAGVPATVFGLRIAQEVINEREEWKAGDVPLDVAWLDSIDDMLAHGKAVRVRHWGEFADTEAENSLSRQFIPESATLVDAYHFGEVWRRADLGVQERMACILAALMCRGHMTQLKRHIGYALDAGLNEKQICEVFAQAGWYRGWPCVEDALEQAKEVFDARGTLGE
ncbi:MAG: carboxymuconolactone decarboxylase family protein [Chloroflexota bacterium]|nr:carboxymuconolactone decarboxylase family protein [Chloroflexota bacterium]MDE2684633.1 carboxymuconolactone decarboxylase family protein [Chloroflexota bacterium]